MHKICNMDVENILKIYFFQCQNHRLLFMINIFSCIASPKWHKHYIHNLKTVGYPECCMSIVYIKWDSMHLNENHLKSAWHCLSNIFKHNIKEIFIWNLRVKMSDADIFLLIIIMHDCLRNIIDQLIWRFLLLFHNICNFEPLKVVVVRSLKGLKNT